MAMGNDQDQASRSGSGNDNSCNSGNGNGTETSFAQQSNKHADKTCYCCGQKGHIPKDCSQKDKPKAQWWINKITAQHMQTQDNESQQADQQTPGGQWNSIQMSGFSGFQMNPRSPSSELISLHTTQDLKDMILMDTGSMLSMFMNETFLKDIRPSESTCRMSTNNGSKQLTHEGVLPGGHHELVHYDPTSIANIMAFCKVLKDPTVR
jgi:hypothetical protein